MSDAGRRLLVVLTLILVFGGIAVVDRVAGRATASPVVPGPPTESTRRVAPVGVESAAWYCAGGTPSSGGVATLILVNTGPTPVRGTVTITSSLSPTSSIPVDVPAQGTGDVGLGNVTAGSELGVSVVLDGGGVAAWEEVGGPSGWSVAPCSAALSPQWYFAHGSTRTGDGFSLVLYNPGATDAVSDVTLLTSTEGLVSPAAFQGVDVGAGSLVMENVGDHVQDDPDIGAEVTALSGSLVACELQSTSQSGLVGFSLLPGAPAAVRTSAFAQSTDPAGGGTSYYLMNPSATPVAVSAAIGLQHGSASPIGIDVRAHATATLEASDEPRIPLSIPYSLTFSAGGAGVVVGRALRAPPTVAPPQVGMDEAVPVGPRRWVVPAVQQPATVAWQLAVVDLTGRLVSVTVLSPWRGGWRRIAVAPSEAVPGVPLLVASDAATPIGTAPIQVAASGAVAVQLEAVPAGAPSVVVVPALALG